MIKQFLIYTFSITLVILVGCQSNNNEEQPQTSTEKKRSENGRDGSCSYANKYG